MGRAQLIDLYGWLVVVAFAAVVGSVIWVWTFWDWRSSPLGRSYMAMKFLLAAALAPPVLQKLTGVSLATRAYLWFYCGVMALLAPAVIWRAAVLWNLQRKELRDGDDLR